MRRARWFTSILACVGMMIPIGSTAAAAVQLPVLSEIDRSLMELLEDEETASFVVVFTAQADLAEASAIDDFDERGSYVVDELQSVAKSAQARALEVVADAGGKATSYWVRNVMVVEGDADLVESLAAIPGVAEVRTERVLPLIDPIKVAAEDEGAAPEWGIETIGAVSVWQDGVLGGGVVVANIDSGVDYTHPALVAQYRGTVGDGSFVHDYNWFDPTGACDEPCDSVGHGTHTMGTMVGGDGPGPFTPDIGVAPGADWIAARGCEDLGCSESSLLAAGQWVLAPTDRNGENPDPSKRPDIVNNSWGGFPGDDFYHDLVSAWRAAGIVPVFSSGNPGPFCGEGGSPGDYPEAISVGATDINDVIAEFSGRGPSVYGKVNPNVSAPGVDVLSSVPGGGFEVYSGTSMAAPHVAGAIALMMSAQPDLFGDVDAAQAVIESTAVDIIDLSCGGDEDGDPNNVYGEGRIDAAAAVGLVATGGTLEGTVAGTDGTALAGARVSASNGEREFSTVTDGDGAYKLFLAEGAYVVSVDLFGYESQLVSGVEVITDSTTTQDFTLEALPSYVVTGRVVYAENRNGVPNAVVTALGVPVDPVEADRFGRFRITLPLGEYTLEGRQGGCTTVGTAEVVLDRSVQATIEVTQKIDDFGHGCSPLHERPREGRFQTALYGDDVYGRLALPFTFPFYDSAYDEVFIDSNGYLTFEDPFFSDFFNTEIPSAITPNTAIYALWTDLWILEDGQVGYGSGGRSPNRWFSVDYQAVQPFGGGEATDVSVTLWENGTIDMFYGDSSGAPGNGATATIGLESVDGTDAFQFSYREALLQPNDAYRYSVVPTGFAVGTVTNANDGLPVAGAVITAEPGGRTATTGEDGTYALRLVPGNYTLTADATDHEPATADATIEADTNVTVDFSLAAAVASVEPSAISASAEFGTTATETVTVSNVGSAPLEFELRERDRSETEAMPELEPAIGVDGEPLIRPNEWAPFEVPGGAIVPTGTAGLLYDGPLEVVIDDPDDDAVGSMEVTQILGGSDGTEMSIQIDLAAGSPVEELTGYVMLDTDQDVLTGISPEELFGLPTQELGIDYFVDFFDVYIIGAVYIVDAQTFELIAEVPATVDGLSMRFDVDLGVLGDDGAMNIGAVVGDYIEPTDWVPDAGFGVLQPGRDAPWLVASPESGIVDVGGSQALEIVLGGADTLPGTYLADLIVSTNDPRTPDHIVEVAFEVTSPDGFGTVRGLVSNSRTGDPVSATLSVDAELDGQAYPIEVTSDEAGAYVLFGPAGTWPTAVTADGYVDLDTEITIPDGGETVVDIGLDPLWPFATLAGSPIELAVEQDGTAEAELVLGNDGTVPLEFTVSELDIVLEGFAAAAFDRRSTEAPAGWAASAVDVRLDGEPALVIMDALPWESGAMFDVLDSYGAAYDVAGSADLPGLNLGAYGAVFVANDQSQSFYTALADEMPALEAYVESGGYLWLGVAGWGWQGGEPDGLPLPGGGQVDGFDPWDENEITAPDHPIVDGMASPFFGSSASHTTVSGYPAGTEIATTPFGDVTLVEYGLGAGRVMVVTQPVEYGWEFGEDTGLLLINGVPLALGFQPAGEVDWLSVDPVDGQVAAGSSQTLTVSVDMSGLDSGTYQATLLIRTNDPLGGQLVVPVRVEVG